MPKHDSIEDLALRLNAIIETAIDGVITIDEHGVVESINSSGARLFGYDPNEVIGKKINMLMPEPFQTEHDGYIENYLKTGAAKIIGIGREVPGLKKDGSQFPFRLAVSEVKLRDNKMIFTGIIHDISAQKKAEEKLVQYSEQLEEEVHRRTKELAEANSQLERSLMKEIELNELKSRFVSLASHEFRTPLSTIMSSVTLIDRYEDPSYVEKRKKHISRVKASVRNLTSILNDFLSLEKLERGKVLPSPIYCIPTQVIDEVVEELKEAFHKGHIFKKFYEAKAHKEAWIDPVLFKNILQNLLSNALKYSPNESEIHIHFQDDQDVFHVQIKDHGMGIPIDEQVHLFERFFRAHNVGTIQGTGLGLSIVKDYVQLMGGSIRFESEVDKGSIFFIQLPWQVPGS